MDYNRIYESFIADRRSKGKPSGYTEKHHILPRSFGGNDDPDNLIHLTASDHLFAHLLLAKVYGGAMWDAFYFMNKIARYSGKNSRAMYKISRENFSNNRSEALSGKKKSEDHKKKIGIANSGKKRDLTIATIAAAKVNKGKKRSIETVEKIKNSLKGKSFGGALAKHKSEEHKSAISKALKGRVFSPEHLQKMKKAQKLRRIREKQAA